MALYARAREFLISRLSERNGLGESKIEAEMRVFDEASRQVEEEARCVQVAAESQLTSAYSGPISSAARSGQNPDAELQVQLRTASEAPSAPLKISAPDPLRPTTVSRAP